MRIGVVGLCLLENFGEVNECDWRNQKARRDPAKVRAHGCTPKAWLSYVGIGVCMYCR